MDSPAVTFGVIVNTSPSNIIQVGSEVSSLPKNAERVSMSWFASENTSDTL